MKRTLITLGTGLFAVSSFALPQDYGKITLRTIEHARYTVLVHFNDPVATPSTTLVSPSPSPTQPTAAATQPTIIINNTNLVQPQQQPAQVVPPVIVVAPTPAAPRYEARSPAQLIVDVYGLVNNHDWARLTQFTANGHTNYFGDSYSSNNGIRNEMERDAQVYGQWHCHWYPDTFTHEVSNEYSPHWNGPMIYDSVNVYAEVYEVGVRWHRALERITVGYTVVDGQTTIYAIVMKVL